MTSHTLSSTAQRSYWLGRYLERTETTARLITVHANLLIDLPRRIPLAWRPLVTITGSAGLYDQLYDETTERNVCRFLINDARNAGSLLSSLSWARENARTLRGIIPRAAFEFVNDAYLFAREHLTEPLPRTRRVSGLTSITTFIQQVDGFMSANMLHDAHWNFLRIGQFIERADMTTRLIDAGTGSFWNSANDLEPFADIQWRSVLRSLYALQSYYTAVSEPISQAPVIHFLMCDRRLPRSVAYCLNSVRNNLRGLPRHDKPLAAVNGMRRQLDRMSMQDLSSQELSDYLDLCQVRLGEIHAQINKTFFEFQPRRARAARRRAAANGAQAQQDHQRPDQRRKAASPHQATRR